MSTRLHLLLPVAAGLLPLGSYAQTPVPRPRFYVGLAAVGSTVKSPDGFGNAPATPTTRNSLPVLPRLTAGWQLAPRLALQASAQVAQQRDTYSFVQQRFDASGQSYLLPGSYGFRLRSVAVPVLLRYTLTANPAHRVQFDALGGVTLVRRSTQYHNALNILPVDSTQAPRSAYDYTAAATDVHATLGLGVRYRVAPRFELTGDVLANYRLNAPSRPAVSIIALEPPQRLALTGSLGVHYLFGNR